MAERNKIEQLLDFAINEEILSAEFYTNLAAQAESPAMREVFEDFAREELRHKAKLEAIKAHKAFNYVAQKITDLKIADYLVDVEPTSAMDYRGALILAMKKEKAAFKLYSDLAEIARLAAVRTCAQKMRSTYRYSCYRTSSNTPCSTNRVRCRSTCVGSPPPCTSSPISMFSVIAYSVRFALEMSISRPSARAIL